MISAVYDSVKVYVWGNGRYALFYDQLKTGTLISSSTANLRDNSTKTSFIALILHILYSMR